MGSRDTLTSWSATDTNTFGVRGQNEDFTHLRNAYGENRHVVQNGGGSAAVAWRDAEAAAGSPRVEAAARRARCDRGCAHVDRFIGVACAINFPANFVSSASLALAGAL